MDNQNTLSDGRALGYREFGASDGFPVINNHGGLMCGADIAPAHEIALQLGARIISPDRPGVAASALQENRTLFDWPNDVRELADRLRIERFSVLGWSMGGQYALACTYALDARIHHSAVIAGCLPLNDQNNFSALNRMDQKLTRLSQHHPHEAALAFKAMGEFAQHSPHMWLEMTARGLSSSDAQTLEKIGTDAFSAMSAPALLTPDGMVQEYRAWALPWGFAPSELCGAVTLWQGDADKLVPPAWAENLASQIPNATLHRIPGKGHFLAYDYWSDILRELVPYSKQLK